MDEKRTSCKCGWWPPALCQPPCEVAIEREKKAAIAQIVHDELQLSLFFEQRPSAE